MSIVLLELQKYRETYTNPNYLTRAQISINMNLDTQTNSRNVYNTFSLLGDIGGFYGLFVSFASVILGILNFNKPENYCAEDLFKFQNNKEKVELLSGKQFALKEYFQSILPLKCLKCWFCKCIRPNRHDRLFNRARDHLQQELCYVGLIQQLRFFNAAFSVLLSSE